MKTVLLLEAQDQADLRTGRPVEIQISQGQTFFLQFALRPAARALNGAKPSARNARTLPEPNPTPKPLRARRREFTPKFRRTIVAEVVNAQKNGKTKVSPYRVAKEHGLWPSVVARWVHEAAKA